jgi:hypothetical protein
VVTATADSISRDMRYQAGGHAASFRPALTVD